MALLSISRDDAATIKFFHGGSFNRTKVCADFAAKFAHDSYCHSARVIDLKTLLGLMNVDASGTRSTISDVH